LADIGLEFGHEICVKIAACKVEDLDDYPDTQENGKGRFTLGEITGFQCINDFTVIMWDGSVFQRDR
jgi:hypothetical protein